MITITVRETAAVDFRSGTLVFPNATAEVHLLAKGIAPVFLQAFNGDDLKELQWDAKDWVFANVAPAHQTEPAKQGYLFGRENWLDWFKGLPEVL